MRTSTEEMAMPSDTSDTNGATSNAGATPVRSTQSGTSSAAIDVAAMLAMTANADEPTASEAPTDDARADRNAGERPQRRST